MVPKLKELNKPALLYEEWIKTRPKLNCPTIPGVSTRLYWPFEDPVEYQGNDEEKLAKFREVRDQIHERIKAWLKERWIPIGKN